MDLEICWLDEDGGGSMVLNTVEFDVEKVPEPDIKMESSSRC